MVGILCTTFVSMSAVLLYTVKIEDTQQFFNMATQPVSVSVLWIELVERQETMFYFNKLSNLENFCSTWQHS